MAVTISPPPSPPAGGPADAPATLTVTYYQQLATHFSEIIDAIATIIPRDTEQVQDVRLVRSRLNVPVKFLGTAVASVEQVEELRNVRKLDVNRGRDTLQLIDAFRPIRDKVAAFAKDLDDALNSRQTALAGEALNAYDTAKSLARGGTNPALTSWVENMQRDLGRRGPRAKKPAPDPAPAPPPTTPAPEKSKEWKG